MVSSAAGFLLALISAMFNGSFAAIQKHPVVQQASPHPIIFNFFMSIGVIVSSLIVMPFLPLLGVDLKFNALGMLSGALFVLSTTCSFFAIPRIGLAMAQGVWGGTALTVSFLWGVLGPSPVGSVPRSWAGSLGAIAILLLGVMGIIFHDKVATKLFKSKSNNGANGPSDDYGVLPGGDEDVEAGQDNNAAKNKDQMTGLLFALGVGLAGGSINVPTVLTALTDEPLAGIESLPSFGTGVLIAALIVPVVYFKCIDPSAFTESGGFHFRALLVPGLICGTMWNIGNVCSVYAIEGISFAIAQSLLQCALLFSGLLGIFVFKEITGTTKIRTFFFFALTVLAGASMLSVYGPEG